MPMVRVRYPHDWELRARRVKERAMWRCKWCGKQCRRPGEPFDAHGRTLTTAHLDHDPPNPRAWPRCVPPATCATTPTRGGIQPS